MQNVWKVKDGLKCPHCDKAVKQVNIKQNQPRAHPCNHHVAIFPYEGVVQSMESLESR